GPCDYNVDVIKLDAVSYTICQAKLPDWEPSPDWEPKYREVAPLRLTLGRPSSAEALDVANNVSTSNSNQKLLRIADNHLAGLGIRAVRACRHPYVVLSLNLVFPSAKT